MAISRTQKGKQQQTQRSPALIVTIVLSFVVVFYFCVFSSSFSSSSYLTHGLSFTSSDTMVVEGEISGWSEKKYLYWGNRVDCPGKHCESCEGLGHQESSLRCALEEAIVLKRVFVMPSRMCINPIHNEKGILHKSNDATSDERWVASSCAMDSLYDLHVISETVPVILDNSKIWYRILSTGMKLGERGIANVEGIGRSDLKDSNFYSNAFLINRTTCPLSWFMECRGRTNRSSTALPYSFLPLMASKRLRDAADKDGPTAFTKSTRKENNQFSVNSRQRPICNFQNFRDLSAIRPKLQKPRFATAAALGGGGWWLRRRGSGAGG